MLRTALALQARFCSKSDALATVASRFSEKWSKARTLVRLNDLRPQFMRSFHVAPTASLVGQVYIGQKCSIMGNSVIRGDLNYVQLEKGVYVGENCVISACSSIPNGITSEVYIANDTIIEAGCTLYSCRIGQNCLVGEGSVVMEGAVLEPGAVLAPGSVVPPARVVPGEQIWGGNPIKFMEYCEHKHAKTTMKLARFYNQAGVKHEAEYLPYPNAFLQRENQPDPDPSLVLGLSETDRPFPYFAKYFC